MNARIAETIAGLERFMATADDALAIPREAGEFLHALVLATAAKRGVEIGTSYGYSGLWIASALSGNGGRLVTIDNDPRKCEAARKNFEQAGLADCVEIRAGVGVEVLESLDGPVDFVLNDADKESCIRYVQLITGRLVDRGVVVTDNIVSHAKQLADFVAWIRGRDDFYSTMVPIGNGMELSIKRAHPRVGANRESQVRLP